MKQEEQRAGDETKKHDDGHERPSVVSQPPPPSLGVMVWPRDFTLLKAHSQRIVSKWKRCPNWWSKSNKERPLDVGEPQNDRDMKHQLQRKMIKYAWLLVVLFLVLIVVKEYSLMGSISERSDTTDRDGKRTIIVIEESSPPDFPDQEELAKYVKARVLVPSPPEEPILARSSSISVDNVPVPSDYRYDPGEAFERRRNILNYVCDQYSDPLQPEFVVVQNFTQLEDRRSFLLNHGLSVCLNDFTSSELLGSLFLQMVEEKAESETNTMDPCSKEEFDEAVASNYHPESDVGNFGSSDWRPRCNLMRAMDLMPFKILAVQHPMEKLVYVFDEIVKKEGETYQELTKQIRQRYGLELTFKTFMVYLIKGSLDFGDAVVYPEEFMPYWSVCNTCAHPYRPSIILKYEHLGRDLLEMFRILGFSEYVKDMPNGLSASTVEGVSDEASAYYKQLPKSLVADIYQLYKADHEIFGYDPRPYIDLGFE